MVLEDIARHCPRKPTATKSAVYFPQHRITAAIRQTQTVSDPRPRSPRQGTLGGADALRVLLLLSGAGVTRLGAQPGSMATKRRGAQQPKGKGGDADPTGSLLGYHSRQAPKKGSGWGEGQCQDQGPGQDPVRQRAANPTLAAPNKALRRGLVACGGRRCMAMAYGGRGRDARDVPLAYGVCTLSMGWA